MSYIDELNCDTRIKDLYKKHNVYVESLYNREHNPFWRKAIGIFKPRTDIIAVAPALETTELNYVLLHELIHWTGSNRRLNRDYIAHIQERGYIIANRMKKEELIADNGAKVLAKQLNIAITLQDTLENRVKVWKRYKYVDKKIIKKDTLQAVNYLLG